MSNEVVPSKKVKSYTTIVLLDIDWDDGSVSSDLYSTTTNLDGVDDVSMTQAVAAVLANLIKRRGSK